MFEIANHLGYALTPASRRLLRRRLDALTEDGWLEIATDRRPAVWKLTGVGQRAAKRSRTEAWAALPESPQHRAWREARRAAEQQITELRARAREALLESAAALEAEKDSTSHLKLTAGLCCAFWRLAAANYCLFEWEEPDDAQADVDLRPGRRALRDWRNWSLPLAPDA